MAMAARVRDYHCPFTILVDSREQHPFTFEDIPANADKGGGRVIVETSRVALEVADYSIFSMPQVVIERKSLPDLYASIAIKRANFERRLMMMNDSHDWSAVVVEGQVSQVLTPQPHTDYSPKSLWRTISAWSQRYPGVHWWFMPGRRAAEAQTFWLLHRWYEDHKA